MSEFVMRYWVAILWCVAALISALLLAVQHWFPYVRRLTRIQAYVLGVIALWLGFAFWRCMVGDWVTPLGLLGISMVGGGVVWAAYTIDEFSRRARQHRRLERHDDEIQE